jgi:hypothetical protein
MTNRPHLIVGIEGDTNILTHRFLLHTHGNTQGIEEYKGITA